LPIARRIIGVLVIAGLAWATNQAIVQWRDQVAAIDDEVSELETEVANLRRRIAASENASPSGETDTDDAFDGQAPEPASPPRDRLDKLSLRLEAVSRSRPRLANLNWRRIALAAVIYAIGLFPPAWLLRQAIRSMGQTCRLPTVVAAQLLGHAGKYVPGKAMVVVLRVGAMRRGGVAVLPGTVAVFVETLMMMAVGGCFAGVLLWFLPAPDWIRYAALLVAVIAGLPTLPPILNLVIAKVVGRGGDAEAVAIPRGRAGSELFLAGWGYSLSAWIAIATSFALLVTALPLPGGETAGSSVMMGADRLGFACAAAISLAMVVGFASLIPGGAGIRELVLTTMLSPVIGTPHALLAAVAVRALFLVVECLTAAAAWAWLEKFTHTNDR